jgi:UDP-2,4-diacetamido-2,4,6-trideoxy-beta-L-altropyranose hydrolase
MWETWLKLVVDKIIVIDDFLNRSHNCDLFIDQNLHTSKKERNKINCKKLLGPKYALLRKEFVKSRKIVKERSGKINRILVSFGGSDEKNQTLKVLKAIKKLAEEKINVDVIVGEPNKNKTKIKRICAGMKNSTYYQQPKNMAKIMNKADLAIGAGGIITWERCCLGLPSVVSIVSKNQEDVINAISKKGCLINLGRAERLTSEDYLSAIRNLNPKKLIRMQKKCMGLVDGKGTKRVAKHISLIAKR